MLRAVGGGPGDAGRAMAKQVLLVDDSEVVLKTARIERDGCECVSVESAHAIAEDRPHLVHDARERIGQ